MTARPGAVVLILVGLGGLGPLPSRAQPPPPKPADPRVRLVELQQAGLQEAALAEIEQLRGRLADRGRGLGLDYLRGHLLARGGALRDASAAYAEAMTATPLLAEYSRIHIAIAQERLGHPEVAAGLAATLLGSGPPRSLIEPAASLLARTLEKGGDCRLLNGLLTRRFPVPQRRLLELSRADCNLREGDTEAASRILLALLQEKRSDLIAREAAERMVALSQTETATEVVALIGITFHHHRDFDRSAYYLGQVVVARQAPEQITDFETRYRLVRSQFWQGRFETAATGYGSLAARTEAARETAQALYHQGRSYELAGNWSAAAASYRQAYLAQTQGNWAAASLLAAMRLEWRSGREAAALELYGLLPSRRQWRFELSRAALFLAASDIVSGRGDRAGPWLAAAGRASRSAQLEVAYWQGRLAELQGDLEAAAEGYLAALRSDPFHPLSRGAEARLRREGFREVAVAMGRRLAGSDRAEDLHSAWLLLGDDHPQGRSARQGLVERLLQDRGTRPFLSLQEVAVEDWPLWQARLTQPEELLLALGIWHEGAPVVTRHFPIASPDLALTASRHLQAAGSSRRSLWIAEVMSERIPSRLPAALLPLEYRRVLHPLNFSELLRRSARRRDVDPYLLAAIIREESRFDPRASSSASARGLTQFVYPTAQRLAVQIGLGPLSPEDLEDPEVSIELGAAYLSELAERYRGFEHQMISAYNAGDYQTQLWKRYCYSFEPEEFYTKVSFHETRGYLAKVLRSRAQYADLWSEATLASHDPASESLRGR